MGLSETITLCLVFRCQHSDGDVVRALLAGCVGDCHLEGVDALLETTYLQQPWMSRLQHRQKKTNKKNKQQMLVMGYKICFCQITQIKKKEKLFVLLEPLLACSHGVMAEGVQYTKNTYKK